MNVVNGVLRDLYMVFLILAMWELIFGHDLLFQPARVALVAITVVLEFFFIVLIVLSAAGHIISIQ